jgi:hypothetical protein
LTAFLSGYICETRNGSRPETKRSAGDRTALTDKWKGVSQAMNFLEFGIQNENSTVLPRRILARVLLEWEKKRADLCEFYVNHKKITFPDGPEENAALLRAIEEQIRENADESISS